MPAAITLKNLSKDFDGFDVIRSVDLSIEPGEFAVFVGPSGCGKSTLLRMIAGLEDISSGDLFFDSDRVNDWAPAKRRVGMVFQSYALYPHMTVEQNIGFGLKLAKKSKAERTKRVEEAIRILQLESLRKRKPSALSGGQRQRVAIGRAIVRRPNVFLFDEPLSNLDASLRVQMRMEIGKLHRRIKNTVIYVTHDQVEAMTLADRIVVLDQGKIKQIGTPMELYASPQNKFVAGFIGSPTMGFMKAKIARKTKGKYHFNLQDENSVSLEIPNRNRNLDTLDWVWLGIRPEHCLIADPDATKPSGEILELERLGSDTFAFLDMPCAEQPVAVRVKPGRGFKAGDRVSLDIDPHHVHIFGQDGTAFQPSESEI